jgi:hypothetical protein
MNRRTARPATRILASALAPMLAAGAITIVAQPPTQAAPQNACSGAFCTTFDLGTFDALAPTQATTAAGQPTNLALRFTDSSPSVATDKSLWLAKVSAQLGSSSSKAFTVTDPASLPVGAYVAGSSATAAGCASATDFAGACPAGYGSGLVEATGLLPTAIKSATFGISRITVGAAGAMTAEVTVRVDGELLPSTTTTPLTFALPTSTSGPSLTLDTRPAVTPPLGYLAAEFSMNDLHLNLNGLVTEAATGAVSPSVPFVRHSLLCTSVTSTLSANARGPVAVAAPFTQTINGCPAAASLVSVVPDPANPTAFTFTVDPPSAAVPGRTASLEWVFGDGAKAVTGPTTSHTYPVANPVVALVTVVDSAGARSSTLQVHIGASVVRGKQVEGHLIKGKVADQDTGEGLGGEVVLGYRCPTRKAPVSDCSQIGKSVSKANGAYRLRIPEVQKKGFVRVSHAGTPTTSADESARFGDSRVVDVLPQPEVTLKVSDKSVRPGATVRLTGKVQPGKKGKTVRLQGFIRGKWRSIGKTTISQRGTYALRYAVRVPGQDKLRVRATVDGTAQTLKARSKVRTIKILR